MSDAWRVMPIPGFPRGRALLAIAALKARGAGNSILRKQVAELEIGKRRLWDAVRATGELLRNLMPEDD